MFNSFLLSIGFYNISIWTFKISALWYTVYCKCAAIFVKAVRLCTDLICWGPPNCLLCPIGWTDLQHYTVCKVWPIPTCTPASYYVLDFEEGQTSASHKSTAHGVCDTSLPVLKMISTSKQFLACFYQIVCLPCRVCSCNRCFPVCPKISNIFDIYEIAEALTRVVKYLYIMFSSINAETLSFFSIPSLYVNTPAHYRLLLLIISQFKRQIKIFACFKWFSY